jgi:hypothetical protein
MAAPLIPLYGTIQNPLDSEVFYIVGETQLSPTRYSYKGKIGYGWVAEDPNNTSEQEAGMPISYCSSDMRDFVFRYDTSDNSVHVQTYYRYAYAPEEAARLKRNVVGDTADSDSFAYFRFPRSKDGIAVSRVFNTIFAGKDIRIYLPAEEAE